MVRRWVRRVERYWSSVDFLRVGVGELGDGAGSVAVVGPVGTGVGEWWRDGLGLGHCVEWDGVKFEYWLEKKWSSSVCSLFC